MRVSSVLSPKVIVVAIAAVIFNETAAAQEVMLEEVLVTAEKREQSLQDVPISIVAFDADMLDTLGINELSDINASIPNLNVNNFNNDPVAVRMFIRGIGQNDLQITQDPSVALYLDGVYIGTSFGAGFEGVDTERLEVLRGPQGTLYGRNATGGAINIITKRASTKGVTFHQTLEAGNLNLLRSRTFLNVPVGDKFAFKLGYLHTDRDGYVENNGVGSDFGAEERRSTVVDLHFAPSDTLTFDYRYEDASINDTGRLEQAIRAGDDAVLSPGVPDLSALVTEGIVSEDRQDKIVALWDSGPGDVGIEGHTLHIGWELSNFMTLKSITADRTMGSQTETIVLPTWTANLVPGGGFIANGINHVDFEQFSQEFQLIGAWENWDLVTGIYYYQDEGTQDGTPTSSLGLPPPENDFTDTENDSLAIYSQATWNPSIMNARWHITLGARYSEDTREAFRLSTRNADFAANAPDGADYKRDFSNFNPTFTLAYDIDDNSNIYGKIVNGYKSGGTSTRSAHPSLFQDGFGEEDIWSYEVGYKSELLDRRVRFNSAIFYMEMDGLQTSVQTGSTPGERDFLPIDDNRVSGLELDVTVAITSTLTGTFSYGYLDTELGQDSIVTSVATFDLIDVYAYAPENSARLSLAYSRALGNGTFGAYLGYSYQDESASSVNVVEAGGRNSERNLVDANLRWGDIQLGSLPGTLNIMLWGKNLTDDEYLLLNTSSWGFVGANEVATFGDPRTYGLRFSYDY
ncbi:MAG: TonB-dependent receptor [Halioglobus sp.]